LKTFPTQVDPGTTFTQTISTAYVPENWNMSEDGGATIQGWILPKLDIATEIWSTRVYFYVNVSAINDHINNIGLQNTHTDARTGTNPGGYACFIEFPFLTAHVSFGGATALTLDDNQFIDRSGVVVSPFNDDGFKDDGTTASGTARYDDSPTITKIDTGQAAGGWLVVFSKRFENGDDQNQEAQSYSTYRAFVYNPQNGIHTQIDKKSFNPWHYSDDIGASSDVAYQVPSRQVTWIKERNTIYGIDIMTGADHRNLHFYTIGSFNPGGGGDVLPPYIIFQMLTSPVFGLGIDEADIDTASYEAALLYCDAENFWVSTQYRREESSLSVIEALLGIYGGFLIISDGKIKFKQLEFQNGLAGAVRVLDNDHLIKDSEDEPVQTTRAAVQDTFNKIRVNYVDRSLSYQQNQVEEGDEVDQDLNGIRMREFPATFTMTEATARKIAVRALWSNLYGKDTYSFKLGWKDADLEPGDVITLVDSHDTNLQQGVVARIVQWNEVERGKFDVIAKSELEYVLTDEVDALDITSAFVFDRGVPEPAYFNAYELPAEFQLTDMATIYIGWVPVGGEVAGANLWVSADGVSFAQSDRVIPFPLGGKLIGGLPADSITNENVEVVLFPKSDYHDTSCAEFNQVLNEATATTRAIGAAVMWVGSEMIAYEGVTLLGQNHYRFDKIYRGWGGTPVNAHTSGDYWWKHGGGVFVQQYGVDKIGTVVAYKVQPFNLFGTKIAVDSIDAQTYTLLGTNWLPQSPPMPRQIVSSLDLRGKTTYFINSTDNIHLDWRDSARLSGFGVGGYGNQLYGAFTTAPNTVSWGVEVIGSGGLSVRSVEVSTAAFTYTSSENFDDNGAWRGDLTFNLHAVNEYGDSIITRQLTVELWT
jgi:hypothetical protein